MKQIASCVLLVFLALPALGQGQLREVDVRVGDVGSGTLYSAVVRNIGKPLQRQAARTGASLSCTWAAETDVTLFYPGLRVSLRGAGRGRNPTVYSIEVSSPRWMVSGARVGASMKEVEGKFGEPVSKAGGSDEAIFRYVTKGNLGTVNFHFRDGKLVKVAMTETLC